MSKVKMAADILTRQMKECIEERMKKYIAVDSGWPIGEAVAKYFRKMERKQMWEDLFKK